MFKELLLKNHCHNSRCFELMNQLAAMYVPLILLVLQLVHFPHKVLEHDCRFFRDRCENVNISNRYLICCFREVSVITIGAGTVVEQVLFQQVHHQNCRVRFPKQNSPLEQVQVVRLTVGDNFLHNLHLLQERQTLEPVDNDVTLKEKTQVLLLILAL